ncbi:MAG: RHS repeat-associated core domain-containing protein [Myxococcales bacterium]
MPFGDAHGGQLLTINRHLGTTPTSGNQILSTLYGYDSRDRLTSIENYGFGHTLPISEYAYSYNTGDRIDSFGVTLDGDPQTDETRTYGYDATGQLKTAKDSSNTAVESYNYDANGNQQSWDLDNLNRPQDDGAYTYTYDAEGNRLTRTNTASGDVETYSWDNRNRLTQVQKTDGSTVVFTVEYAYDNENQLVGRRETVGSNDPITNYFVWDNGQIVLRLDGNDEMLNHYTWGFGTDQLLADEQYDADTQALDHLYWTLGDHQGTLRDIAEFTPAAGETDAHTDLVNHRTFDSFGLPTGETDTAIDELFGFTGVYLDPLTGQQYNRARWFDPQLHQWLSDDPLGLAAGDPNVRRYVKNDPVNKTDPSGLEERALSPVESFMLREANSRGVDIPTLVQQLQEEAAIVMAQNRAREWNELSTKIQLEADRRRRAAAEMGVGGAIAVGTLAGSMEIGRALTMPLRLVGRDYSQQDLALEQMWELCQLRAEDEKFTRTGTRAAANVSAQAMTALTLSGPVEGTLTWIGGTRLVQAGMATNTGIVLANGASSGSSG